MFHGLTIKEYINENINNDSDYWYSGNGNWYIISRLLKFDQKNWEKLKYDLTEWELNQIEILALALSDINDLNSKELESIYEERCNLFIHIFLSFQIDLAFDLLDYIDFIFNNNGLKLSVIEKVISRIDQIKRHDSFGLFYSQKRIGQIESKLNEKLKASR